MPLLDEIIEWTGRLRPWQNEALSRIFNRPELTNDDLDAILQMVREQEQEGAAPASDRPFTLDDVSGAGTGATVRLVGISGLDQVNGFPTGRSFELAPEGMTIFFGHNGAGKSGYARVFKNACKARHRVEVLPNAFGAATPPSSPSADFAILVDGVPDTVRWTQNGPPHRHLSSVSVYDSACAKDYIDAEGTPAFQPYGLTHLTRLVQLQRDLQNRIDSERDALVLDARPFEPLKGDTEVGRFIDKLGADSDVAVLARLGTVSEEELQRLVFLRQSLLESDPAPKALDLERLAARLDLAQRRAEVVQRWVNDHSIERTKLLITKEKEAQTAMQLAREHLRGEVRLGATEPLAMRSQSATLLGGTGAALWQTMYRAAEAFSRAEAYPEHTFPHLGADAHCVLCQQPYSSDASELMGRFAAFIADSATADAQAASIEREDALKNLRSVDLNVLDVPTLADLAGRLPDLHAAFSIAASTWSERHTWISRALESADLSTDPESLPNEANIDSLFANAAASLRVDSNTLRTSIDPVVRLALTRELAELQARQQLTSQLGAVQRFIQDSGAHRVLSHCHASLNPAAVSRKLTSLATTHVTEALAASINVELNALGYRHRLQPDLSGRTEFGVTKVTLRLLDSTQKASNILSEGEQRALAMAMFLAELESLPHTSSVIFDDPSTSLDHVYRRAIAQRLVTLAETRQVLVFTHDAVFLTELAMALQRIDRPASYKTIGWDELPGLVSEGLTWATMDTKARLTDLANRAKGLTVPDGAYPGNELERQIAGGYSSLRGTIERAIREIFMNNTVQPFTDVVSVEAFGAVIGHPVEEWEQLLEVYDRACEATEAHDTPSERQLPLPAREDLLNDIALILDLVGKANKRRSAYQAARSGRTERRKKLLSA